MGEDSVTLMLPRKLKLLYVGYKFYYVNNIHFSDAIVVCVQIKLHYEIFNNYVYSDVTYKCTLLLSVSKLNRRKIETIS